LQLPLSETRLRKQQMKFDIMTEKDYESTIQNTTYPDIIARKIQLTLAPTEVKLALAPP
jgi:hypothetical protein